MTNIMLYRIVTLETLVKIKVYEKSNHLDMLQHHVLGPTWLHGNIKLQ
jgi:hypothetical protein